MRRQMSYGPAETSDSYDLPGHVPSELVVDFDLFKMPGAEIDPHGAWKEMQDRQPRMIFTPRNGGHWVAMRADDIYAAIQDFATFSSNPFHIPQRPAGSPITVPLEIDPPALSKYRMIVVPILSP